jgi:hypothetical protein
VVDALFRRARRFVFAALPSPRRPRRRRGEPPAGLPGTPEWWVALFERASARRPELHWEIALDQPRAPGAPIAFRWGGRFAGAGPPRVWVLEDGRPGHATQAVGLAEELGWPYERKELALRRLADVPNPLLGASRLGVRRASARELAPPWPDLVIACGRRLAPVSRWVRAQSRGRTRIVQLGRKGVDPADRFDLTVVPAYARLLPHPRRVEIAAPLTLVRPSALEEAALRWKPLLAAPAPRIALLVGGDSQRHALTPECASRLARDAIELARRLRGSVFATTSRRTSPRAAAALAAGLEGARHVHRWRPGQPGHENPYLGYLALADLLVVTGESASMLAEACATGRPVQIYPLPERRTWRIRLGDAVIEAVVARAHARPRNRRGTARPQKRGERLCARLLATGLVRPVRRIELLHRALVECGAAHPFGSDPEAPRAWSQIGKVADRVRALLGYAGGAVASAASFPQRSSNAS